MIRTPSKYLVVLCLVPVLFAGALAAQEAEMVDKAKDMAMDKAKDMAKDKAKDMAMDKAEDMAGDKEMPAEGPPEMTPEMAAMMGAWQKAMTPGEPHSGLAGAAGQWDMTISSWMDPEAPPMVAQGKAERAMLLGGRVLQEKATSEFQGMPFEGVGMTGYDNVTGEFWSTWMDNMSTGCFVLRGTMDDTGATTFHGEFDDPMTGGKKAVRAVMRNDGADKQVFQWHETLADQPEVKTMEIVYVRASM